MTRPKSYFTAPPRKKICDLVGCQNEWEIAPSTPGRPKAFCSNSCMQKGKRLRKKGMDATDRDCAADDCHIRVENPRAKYCSKSCQAKQSARNVRANERYLKSGGRGGDRYELFVTKRYPLKIETGELKQVEVAQLMETTKAAVSRWQKRFRADKVMADERREWTSPDSGYGLTQFLIDKDPAELTDNFIEFRDKYFRTAQGHRYITAFFHRAWITSILKSLQSGGELMILSPPRHGKTDLLIHFATWLICHIPNINIAWVGGNEDIAKDAVGAVKDHLEANDLLIADFAGPGRQFKPANRSGKSWASNAFSVATQTVTGIKSPTLVAVGRGGKILSRDTDLIVLDDIEDHQSTLAPGGRQATRNWMVTTVGSRKMEHTAIIVIGSRQHIDDLYGHLLENPGWEKIVEEAHDTDCILSEEDFDIHVHCMLFPQIRSYRWLMSRLTNALTTGGRHMYEMVYLNRPVAEGMEIFSKEAIESCQDATRSLGLPMHIGQSLYLIAGLDPAATGYQAAVLWGLDLTNRIMYLIDLDNELGGGVAKARKIIRRWHHEYELAHWVIEENAFQGAIRQDDGLKEYARANSIYLEGHVTSAQNKWDETYGITTMAPMFEDQKINLPYRDSYAQAKVDTYKNQLIHFAKDVTHTGKRRKQVNDVVMAAWFPLKVFRRKIKEFQAQAHVTYDQSFAGYNRSSWNEVPW